MNYPKISIVTPSFNQGQFLEETIRSVIGQGYPNLEYIIIDGGSSDNSKELIKKYQGHLKYWVSEPDSGHAHALNKGFAHATGDIMAWINSDDKYLPWTFKTVAEIFSTHKSIHWISGIPSAYNEFGCLNKTATMYKNMFDFGLFDYEWIQQESCFWTQDLWRRAGGCIDENMKFMVDGELWTRFFLQDRLYYVDGILGGIRDHGERRAPQNLTAIKEEMEQSVLIMKSKLNPKVTSALEIIESDLNHINKLGNWGGILPRSILYRYRESVIRKVRAKLRQLDISPNETNYKLLYNEGSNWLISEIDFFHLKK